MKRPDKIYSTPLHEIVDFRFDEKVAAVFPDMLNRSVPGYGLMITNIGILAGRYTQAGSRCYDLGCSLGAATLAMRQRITVEDCHIVAVDNSKAMIERAQQLLEGDAATAPVELVCADILDVRINNASVVVLNLTLQFIPVDRRSELIKNIHAGLRPGGILILAEKVAFDDEARQELLTDLHHEFKRAQGYSDLEVSQKRTALENVMIPESLDIHIERLGQAGFAVVEPWFQCFNFASLVAFK
ncbi:MAG: carboxy-S-adenosyl-L-methionine synthase CmoA [Desulfuromonas sp.]|nr:MAG: carboxy-S-adenosyl-L-methionine synthase CmoA [Desulfuromonas sp.]